MADGTAPLVAKDGSPRKPSPLNERVPRTKTEAYSRKDKSLGLLCENFVNVYGQREGEELCLDAAATRLGVERRRIYDIVNVLESVGVVTRKAKNCYIWKGSTEVASKIEDLRRKASIDCFGGPEDFRRSKKKPRGVKSEAKALSPTPLSSQETGASQSDLSRPPSQSISIGSANGLQELGPVKHGPVTVSRKEKSLGVLSQRFVQLFLMADDAVVSLEQAALQLMGHSPSDSEPVSIEGDATKILKTKVRRLYDIANILSSLNIIEKVATRKRKPAFQWVGIHDATFSPGRRKSLKRIAESSTPPGSATKRLKCFSSPYHGYFDDSMNSSLSPGSVSLDKCRGSASKMPASKTMGSRIPGNPFDDDTLSKLNDSLRSMPPSFAERWSDWVTQAQDLVKEGKMTAEDAESGIVQLLGPRNANGLFSPRVVSPLKPVSRVDTPVKADDPGGQTNYVQQKISFEKAVQAKSVEAEASPTTDVDEVAVNVVQAAAGTAAEAQAQLEAQAQIEAQTQAEASSGVGGAMAAQASFEWMTPEYIDSYMKQAKEAGPDFAQKAEVWLRQLRQWETTWAPYRATMQNYSGASAMAQPQNEA